MANSGNPVTGDNVPVTDTDWGIRVTKTMTFAGGTTNDPGDYDGSGNPATLFTVNGLVVIRLFAYCTTSLVGNNATLTVGTADDPDALLVSTTGTDIDKGEIWHDASPDIDIEASTVATEYIMCGTDSNIIQTVGTANITAGAINYVCCWYPISDDGKVEAA